MTGPLGGRGPKSMAQAPEWTRSRRIGPRIDSSSARRRSCFYPLRVRHEGRRVWRRSSVWRRPFANGRRPCDRVNVAARLATPVTAQGVGHFAQIVQGARAWRRRQSSEIRVTSLYGHFGRGASMSRANHQLFNDVPLRVSVIDRGDRGRCGVVPDTQTSANARQTPSLLSWRSARTSGP